MRKRFRSGERVVITINAGLCAPDDERRFVGSCGPGTPGEYIGPHPNKKLSGWHLVKVGALVAPLGPGQFEASE